MKTLQDPPRPRRSAGLRPIRPLLVRLVFAVSLLPGTVAAASTPGRPSGDLRRATIPLATGVALDVTESGPADGRPVLFLHGITDSWYSWTPVLERLPRDVRAIVPSQRGHGDSERPVCCYGLEDFVQDAVSLLDALGIERATVVGHSMGSFVAQRMAVTSPDRVERLVLVGSGVSPSSPGARELGAIVQSFGDSVPATFVRDFQVSTIATEVPDPFLEAVITESRKVPARVWRDAFAGFAGRPRAAELSRLGAPTLIVSGVHDDVWPTVQQDSLAAALPQARRVTHARAGHAPHWEDPDWFVTELAAFMDARTALGAAGDHFLPLGDATLRYRDLGGPGEAVVLLHGYSNRLETWLAIADSLTVSHRVIALDLRGFGGSKVPEGRPRFGRAMADDVGALLDALGLEEAHVVGFSLGGLVAAAFAVDAPDRVASLTLLAAPLFADSAALADTLAPHVSDLERGLGLGSFFAWAYPAATPQAVARTSERAVASNDPVALLGVARSMAALVPDSGALRRLEIPTLVAVGDADPLFQAATRAARLVGGHLVVLEGGDHSATVRQPTWLPAFRRLARGAKSARDARVGDRERAVRGRLGELTGFALGMLESTMTLPIFVKRLLEPDDRAEAEALADVPTERISGG